MSDRTRILDQKNKVTALLKTAIKALEEHNFKAYIRYLDELGIYLNYLYRSEKRASSSSDDHQDPYTSPEDEDEFTQQQFAELKIKKTLAKKAKNEWLAIYITEHFEIKDPFAFCVFEEAWIDDYLRNPVSVNGVNSDRRFLSPKANLNASTRRHINLAMHAVAIALKRDEFPVLMEEPKNIADLDKLACKAIKSYKTKQQRVLETSGFIIAIVMSIVCSLITAGAVAITLAAWPLAIVATIVAIVFVATLVINWLSYRRLIPRMLSDMFGKDSILEGWLIYRDSEKGEKKRLSPTRRVILALSTMIITVIGIASGTVTYNFILSLGNLALFPFLAAGTLGAAFLPPLGMFIAGVFCTSSIALMLKPILNFLRATSIKKVLIAPFAHTQAIFDPNNPKNKGTNPSHLKKAKIITYIILGFVSAFTLFGLIILQIRNAAALETFLNQTLAVSSVIAIGVAHTMSLVSVLIGQLPYALNTVGEILVGIIAGYRNLFNPNAVAEQYYEEPAAAQSTVLAGPQKSIAPTPSLSAFSHVIAFKTRIEEGIKATILELAPDKVLVQEATQARINNLNTHLNHNSNNNLSTTTESEQTLRKPPRRRYYDLYFLFPQKTPRLPTLSPRYRPSVSPK